jgi:hypothetical protein
MKTTIKLIISMLLLGSMLSGCIVDPWWDDGYYGGHHHHHHYRDRW